MSGRMTVKTTDNVLTELRKIAHPDQLPGMAKFGMTTENRLGVSVPDMRRIAKSIGRNHKLALE